MVAFSCNVHGEFQVTTTRNLKLCPKCRGDRISSSKRHTAAQFIEKASKIHGDRYEYSKVEYVNANKVVTITCRTHGDFNQTPGNHTSGKGCRGCQRNGYNTGKPGNFYILRAGNVTKIGITNRDVKLRVKPISKQSGIDFKVFLTLHFEDGKVASTIEKELLDSLKLTHKQPSEVFDGSTECFYDVDTSTVLGKLAILLS